MKTPDVHQVIATIRELLVAPKVTAKMESDLFMSIHHLSTAAEVILSAPELLIEVLALHEAVLSYRGKGSQTGALNMSRLLCYLAMSASDSFSSEVNSSGLPHAPDALMPVTRPEESIWLAALQLMITQDKAMVQGPRSRSRHTSRLRADAWDRLGDLCLIVPDPEIRVLALNTAQDPRADPIERASAVELLPRLVGEDEPDEEIVKTLDGLTVKQADRDLLMAVLQAQIDLGLESELGAICSMDDY